MLGINYVGIKKKKYINRTLKLKLSLIIYTKKIGIKVYKIKMGFQKKYSYCCFKLINNFMK